MNITTIQYMDRLRHRLYLDRIKFGQDYFLPDLGMIKNPNAYSKFLNG